MNLINMMLVAGSAVSPAIGGIVMETLGWPAVFVVMTGGGALLAVVTAVSLRETVVRDISRIKPKALATSYWKLLTNPRFITASLTNAGAPGAVYALATLLPFVLMNRIGLKPSEFGLAMLHVAASHLR